MDEACVFFVQRTVDKSREIMGQHTTKEAILKQINKDHQHALRKVAQYLEDFDLCPAGECVQAANKFLVKPMAALTQMVEDNWESCFDTLKFDEVICVLYQSYSETVEGQLEDLSKQQVGDCVAILFMRLLLKILSESAEDICNRAMNNNN